MRRLTLAEWLAITAIVALLLAMAIPAFTWLKNHAPQTAEQPVAPTNRFTATRQDSPMDLTLWLIKDNATGNEFLFFRAGYGVAAVPLPKPWNTQVNAGRP